MVYPVTMSTTNAASWAGCHVTTTAALSVAGLPTKPQQLEKALLLVLVVTMMSLFDFRVSAD